MTTSVPTEELNALRTRLHNFGLGDWVNRGNTDKRPQMMQVSEACVAALDQFDKFEAEIARLQIECDRWSSVAATRNVNIALIAEDRDRLREIETAAKAVHEHCFIPGNQFSEALAKLFDLVDEDDASAPDVGGGK